MQELIKELNEILQKINTRIETYIKADQIDLNEVDEFIQSDAGLDPSFQESMLNFRAELSKYKSDTDFWDKDIPALFLLLESAKKVVTQVQKDKIEIGGKDLPNEDIIKLIEQDLISTSTPISKTHKNQKCTGYLTSDGFIEIEINGIKKKLSLRRAALSFWGSNPASQWQFWEADDKAGVSRPLDFFRKQLHN